MKTVSLTNISIYRSVYMAHISALLHGAVGAEVQIPSTKNPELSNVSLFFSSKSGMGLNTALIASLAARSSAS